MDDAAVGRIFIGRGGRLQDAVARAEVGGIYDGWDSEADGGAPSEDVDPRCALVEALLFLFGWGILFPSERGVDRELLHPSWSCAP